MVLTKSNQMLKIEKKAPDFNLPAIDGKKYNLESFKSAKALLIIFMCNHCPYVKAKIEVIKKLQRDYKDRDLVIVGINSNEDKTYPEDSFENMKIFAKEKGFNFVYLRDESQKTAKAYGASCTPDPFLFDENGVLVYHGRFNDAFEPGQRATTNDMAEAIEAVLAGKPIEIPFLPSIGCSIKWK